MQRLRCVGKHYGRVRRLNGLNEMTRHDISSKLRSGLKCLPDLISIDMQKERAVLLVIRLLLGHFQWVRVDFLRALSSSSVSFQV
jgi:hypothetical protein